MLIVLMTIWLGGPVQQSTEKSIDTNGLLLGQHALDAIASSVKIAGMSGYGVKHDFTIHIPFNTVDMRVGNDTYNIGNITKTGPHITMTVLLYNNLTNISTGNPIPYMVNDNGNASWCPPGGDLATTSMYYKNLTKALDFEIHDKYFPLCEVKKNATQIRGPSTRFLFVDSYGNTRSILLCSEAGFNLNLYVEKAPADPKRIALRSRQYYSLPGSWTLGP